MAGATGKNEGIGISTANECIITKSGGENLRRICMIAVFKTAIDGVVPTRIAKVHNLLTQRLIVPYRTIGELKAKIIIPAVSRS